MPGLTSRALKTSSVFTEPRAAHRAPGAVYLNVSFIALTLTLPGKV